MTRSTSSASSARIWVSRRRAVPPRQFALDHNFPQPIVDVVAPFLVEAELVPLQRIDTRMTELDDWEVLLALHADHRPWDGLITTDSGMLALPKELAVLLQTKLTLVVAEAAGHGPAEGDGAGSRASTRDLRAHHARDRAALDPPHEPAAAHRPMAALDGHREPAGSEADDALRGTATLSRGARREPPLSFFLSRKRSRSASAAWNESGFLRCPSSRALLTLTWAIARS